MMRVWRRWAVPITWRVTMTTTKTLYPGSLIRVALYGHVQTVRVLRVLPAGTVDVQRADGACFRLSGLA